MSRVVSYAVFDSRQLGSIVQEIERRAYDAGFTNLNVRKYARENGYLTVDQNGNRVLSIDALQEIADIFCDNLDVRVFRRGRI